MIADSLQLAFDRLDDFLAVQRPLALPPVLRLQSAVGIEEHERSVLRERLAQLDEEDRAAPVLLGVLLGLFAAQFEAEA